jgi:hypothetical protein
MDPVSATIIVGAVGAVATVGSAIVAGAGLAHTLRKDARENKRFQDPYQVHCKHRLQKTASKSRQQPNQAPASYNAYPVPQYENVSHHYRTAGRGRVDIGSDGRSISAGGSGPGDFTSGYSTRTIAYSSISGSRPSSNFNQSQYPAQQIPFFLLPPAQQQGGYLQQSPYNASRPASPYRGYNGGQRAIEQGPYGRDIGVNNTIRRMQSFQW